jgi:hypothetical protein
LNTEQDAKSGILFFYLDVSASQPMIGLTTAQSCSQDRGLNRDARGS